MICHIHARPSHMNIPTPPSIAARRPHSPTDTHSLPAVNDYPRSLSAGRLYHARLYQPASRRCGGARPSHRLCASWPTSTTAVAKSIAACHTSVASATVRCFALLNPRATALKACTDRRAQSRLVTFAVVAPSQPAPCRTARSGQVLQLVAVGATGTRASCQQKPAEVAWWRTTRPHAAHCTEAEDVWAKLNRDGRG